MLGKNKVLAWSVEHQEIIELQLKNIWAPYVIAQTCKRPDNSGDSIKRQRFKAAFNHYGRIIMQVAVA